MKKIFYLMAMAIATMVFTSCSDDETSSSFEVNNSITEVSINRLGGEVEIPIKASGEWTATITDNEMDELPWSDVYQEKGVSNGTLTIGVDYFNPALQMHQRKAKITVKSGDKSQVIILRQYIGIEEGESAPNDSTGFLDIWHDKGVGKPLNPLTGDLKANYVLNTKNLIRMAKENSDYSTIFSQTNLPGLNAGIHFTDTLEDNTDSLGVSCTINVKFAKFKLGLNVDYNNHGKQKGHNVTYTGSQDIEFKSSTVSTADVATILSDEWDQENNKWMPNSTLHNEVISIGFRSAWENIMKNTNDKTKLHKAIKNMLSKFGPVLVEGATLGGSIFTAIKFDSLSVQDNFNVHGKVTAAIALSVVDLNGKVEADYSKVGEDIWKDCEFYCSISGGNPDSYKAILSQMDKDLPDRVALRNAAQKWMESIRSTNNREDNTAVISIQYTGIWNLFPFDVADEVQEYIVDYYKNQNICVSLEDMGIIKTMRNSMK